MSVDIATTENLQRLVEIGKELLKKQVSRVNLDTGRLEEIERKCTNEEVLSKEEYPTVCNSNHTVVKD